MDSGPTFSAVIYNLQLRLASIERLVSVLVSAFRWISSLLVLVATYDVILAGVNPLPRLYASLAIFGIYIWVVEKNAWQLLRSNPTDITKNCNNLPFQCEDVRWLE